MALLVPDNAAISEPRFSESRSVALAVAHRDGPCVVRLSWWRIVRRAASFQCDDKLKMSRSLTSSALALNEVFLGRINPARAPSTCSVRLSVLRARCPRRPMSTFIDSRFVSRTQPQGAVPQSKPTGPPRDSNIRAFTIQVVGEDNALEPPQPLRRVLESFDRKLYTLVQVSPPEEGKIPVCRIFEKKALREAERAKAKAQKDPASLVKQLALNWAIGPNDLGHRLNKMVEFLEQGKRVEVILEGKKRGRKAAEEQALEVLRRIRSRVDELDGATEWKAMVGKVPEQVTLYFEGKAKK